MTLPIERFSPVDGRSLGTFDVDDAVAVQAAVTRARARAPSWAATPLADRLVRLQRVVDHLVADADRWVEILSTDTGKPRVDALMTELLSAPLFLDWYRRHAAAVLGRRRVRTPLVFLPRQTWVETFPMGVIAVISPWNFPFQLAFVPVLSALVAGNTVVLKPSEVTPLVADGLRRLARDTGLGDGTLEVLMGGASTGRALCEADVDKIFFTGSVATGRAVMQAAATRPIPVELELGGKDAMIVCHDAPLERAARAAVWGGMVNGGQVCISVERLLVVDAVHDRFVALVRRELEAIRVGSPDEDADMGPFIHAPQRAIVEAQIADALDRGARVVSGGQRQEHGPGCFFTPTLIIGVRPGMTVYDEETFGPVLGVTRVRDEDEAVAMANDHIYGLNASVWTRDTARGLALASRIEAGQVLVNDVISSVGNPSLPFGGVKRSGFGRYHGAEGLLAFCHQRSISVSPAWVPREPFWFPYAGKYPHVRRLFDHAAHGRWGQTALSLVAMLRAEQQPDRTKEKNA
jgi:acyl-CoA reductase-like NAD-dependent aldehyde dehydrogenase